MLQKKTWLLVTFYTTAGVMAMEPKVLILDEPTAGLDPRGRDEILAQIRAYHETKQATVILVSHSMDEIARNVDRILVLKNGRIAESGTFDALMAQKGYFYALYTVSQ